MGGAGPQSRAGGPEFLWRPGILCPGRPGPCQVFTQPELSPKHPAQQAEKPIKAVGGPGRRLVFRPSYDSRGPHDERYYVSASSGIG